MVIIDDFREPENVKYIDVDTKLTKIAIEKLKELMFIRKGYGLPKFTEEEWIKIKINFSNMVLVPQPVADRVIDRAREELGL